LDDFRSARLVFLECVGVILLSHHDEGADENELREQRRDDQEKKRGSEFSQNSNNDSGNDQENHGDRRHHNQQNPADSLYVGHALKGASSPKTPRLKIPLAINSSEVVLKKYAIVLLGRRQALEVLNPFVRL
jgi:hypothetical protein